MTATAQPVADASADANEAFIARGSWRDALTNEELEELRQISPVRSWLLIATNYGIVAAAMAMVVAWPNLLTILLALVIIGGRQLGGAVIMHEAAHRTLFANRALNDWVGNWLGAYPSWSGEVEPYRRYHLVHHAHTGTPRDPDLSLAAPFPVTRAGLWRKLWRDLSGQTGWKQAKLILQRDLGLGSRKNQRNQGLKAGQKPDVGFHKIMPILLTNGVIFGLCWLAGHPAVYLLWPIAWMTTYRAVLRIRSIAEHAMAGDLADPLQQTRTTHASWWERLVFAPNRVNYHLEHHLVMTVPPHNLPRMHRMLEERGVLGKALIGKNYFEVLRDASSRPA